MDGVQGVSVQVAPDGASLCAFVAPQSIDGELVRTRVAERLPRYMIPTKIYGLEKLPLNVNDKIDHKLIRSLLDRFINKAECKAKIYTTDDTQRPSVVHRTVSQNFSVSNISTPSLNSTISMRVETFSSTLEIIWNDVLNISGPRQETDDFFKLGGDSLKIQLLAQKLGKEYNINVRVVDLLTCATIAAQADQLRDAGVSSVPSLRMAPQSPLPGKADQHVLDKATDPMPVDTEHAERRIQALWADVLDARPSRPDERLPVLSPCDAEKGL
ncbi:hypothetical protein M422DRAFT_47291 [Sphaerobolus stellatus SS14]|uniref:Carrier domain-containing protein n=1 Tax=Sphaerobolus stellatus (strain SS14) TaxID=990650 RepID=A0A0C9VC64_SPHS4|nr:hypothetical protein M422DRAFT_47291 [Sphaerobolus stellatus SS14]